MRLFALIVIITLILIIYIANVIKSFDVKFDGLTNVIISGIDFNSFLSNQTVITSRIKLLITFDGIFSILISGLNIKVYKNNLLIAESTKNIQENIKKIKLKPNVDNLIYQTFDLHINNEIGDLILKEKSKQDYNLNYKVFFKIFGISVNKSGTYKKINKK